MTADATPGSAPLLEIRGLRTQFPVREGVVRSVEGVDLDVEAAQTLCVVGESGCGKSVTARSIMQLVDAPGRVVEGVMRFRPRPGTDLGPVPGSGVRRLWRRTAPRDGRIRLDSDGRVDLAALDPDGVAMQRIRGAEIAMVFQEPMASLSPVHTIGRQLVEQIALHQRVSPDEARERAVESLRLVGMPSPQRRLRSYSFELSGGMRQRAMIAMAISCDPQLLIADEPTTALDVTTQRQILDLLLQMRAELGMSIMFITHDLGVVAEIADRVAVMYLGMVVEECSVTQLFDSPRHPYTQALLASAPDTAARGRLRTIRGTVPHALDRPRGCPFVTRCDHVVDACHTAVPPMITAATGPDGRRPARAVRCVHYPDAAAVADGIELDLRPLDRPAAGARR